MPTATAATPLPIARNYLGGAFTSDAASHLDVLDPSDGSIISQVPLSSAAAVDAAVARGRGRFPGLVGDADQGTGPGALPLSRLCSSGTWRS